MNIMNIMDSIEYGFKDKNNRNLIQDEVYWEQHFNDFYYLQSPEELLKSKCGVCWDQVELERKILNDNNINTKTYFIYIHDGDMLPSHTFLTYKENDKIYWFEHSWNEYKGIHEFGSEEELLDDVIKKFKNSHNYVSKGSNLFIYLYNKPNYGISCNDFYKYIETQKLIGVQKV